MTPTPEQLARLPKWARDHVDSLTRQRDNAVERMTEALAGPEDSDTLADPYMDPPRRLGVGTTVRFQLGERWDAYVDGRVDRDRFGVRLYLNGGPALNVLPRSSNVIEVELRERP